MRVNELIEKLKLADQEAIVVLSRDGEGNGYSPLYTVEINMKYHDGEVKFRELTQKLKDSGYSEEDVATKGREAVVLWP
jgi:hypothetical protein